MQIQRENGEEGVGLGGGQILQLLMVNSCTKKEPPCIQPKLSHKHSYHLLSSGETLAHGADELSAAFLHHFETNWTVMETALSTFSISYLRKI